MKLDKRTNGYLDDDGVWHEQCPGCGHNYRQGGSGFCKWCISELKDEGMKSIFTDETKFITCLKHRK